MPERQPLGPSAVNGDSAVPKACFWPVGTANGATWEVGEPSINLSNYLSVKHKGAEGSLGVKYPAQAHSFSPSFIGTGESGLVLSE